MMETYPKMTVRSVVKSLGREQKEAIGLLGMGTFLEYFDLMLFIHMAGMLEKEFFPQNDPHVSAIMGATAFCATFVFRPLGAIIFGWIGDYVGRRYTVMFTAFVSGFICLIMATLSINKGMTAFWIILACRIVQGMASLGEIIGAQIYLSESIPRPVNYVAVSLISLIANWGGMAALGCSVILLRTSLNWRTVFWMGVGTAAIGSVARMRLRETPEFIAMQEERAQEKEALKKENRQKNWEKWQEYLKKPAEEAQGDKNLPGPQPLPAWKTHLAFLGLNCPLPFHFFLGYIYCGSLLKGLGYTPADILSHNFLLTLIDPLTGILGLYLCIRIYPLKIVRFRSLIASAILLFWLILCPDLPTIWSIACLQILLHVFNINTFTSQAILLRAFPVRNRFRSTSLLFALSRAIMHVISSFGVVYLTQWFGNRGLLIVVVPMILFFFWSLQQFESLKNDRAIADVIDDMGFVEMAPPQNLGSSR